MRYSVTRDNAGRNIVVIEHNILKGVKSGHHQVVAAEIATHVGDYYKIIESGQKVYIGDDLPGEYTQSVYTRNLISANRKMLKIKDMADSSLGEMIEIATDRVWEKNRKPKHHMDAKYGWYRYITRFAIPVFDRVGTVVNYNLYSATLLIRNDADGKKYLYDILDIKKESASKLQSSWYSKKRNNSSGSLNTNISESEGNVNKKSFVDNDYLSAVENGDMETAKNLLDEAARKAGLLVYLFDIVWCHRVNCITFKLYIMFWHNEFNYKAFFLII